MKAAKASCSTGHIRIVGGQWRGRKISVLEHPDLRPTGDRLRETVFNWLGQDLHGQCCLDLFAGSGALGFEAASRGARQVVLVESDDRTARALLHTSRELRASGVRIYHEAVESYLQRSPQLFDVIFIDPPYTHYSLEAMFPRLSGWLAPASRIYLEQPQSRPQPLPSQFAVLKSKIVGAAFAQLLGLRSDTAAG